MLHYSSFPAIVYNMVTKVRERCVSSSTSYFLVLIPWLVNPPLPTTSVISSWQRKVPSFLYHRKRFADLHVTVPHPLISSTTFQAAPQLWKLEIVRDRDHNCYTSRLILKHTFVMRVPAEFAGPCYFGGREDQFVLCAGKGTLGCVLTRTVMSSYLS